MEVKIFSHRTCSELLDYRSNKALRALYDNDEFNIQNAEYLSEPLKIDVDPKALSLGTKPSDDLESSIRIFLALSHLDPVQANDKRIWVTLAHGTFFAYIKKRWKIDENTTGATIKDRFHFEGTALRQRNQHSIARLWWSARITVDFKRSDPFELTRLLWEKQDFYQNLIDRKYSTYPGTLVGFLNFYKKNKHLDIKRDLRRLFKGVNAYGGVRILSMLDAAAIEQQLQSISRFYQIKATR
jgi:hypothetical protein